MGYSVGVVCLVVLMGVVAQGQHHYVGELGCSLIFKLD